MSAQSFDTGMAAAQRTADRMSAGARRARVECELRDAAAALLGIEHYAQRVGAQLEAAPVSEDLAPALEALQTIEAHARAVRAGITTVDPTREQP
jgi:hypothetical protein